nr:unnamed protein product [Digitaria exilis]
MNAAGRSRRQSKRKKQEDRAAAAPMAPPFLRLPDVLVEEVLRRLPPKSLARCRCVSPSWNALTSSSAFADHYHAAAAARSAASASAARFVSVPVEHPGEHPHIARRSPEFGSPRCVDCPRVFSGGGKPCHGSGVVLVGRPCKGEFFVCNPSTGGILRLPPRRPSCGIAGAGLGFHPAAGNHKAVLLERVDEPPRRGGLIPRLQLLVFDVAVGVHRQRRWRSPRGKKQTLVAYDDDAVVSTTNTNAVFAGGHLHWILSAASGPSGEPRGILSFSAAGESVARLPLPPFSTADATASTAASAWCTTAAAAANKTTQPMCSTFGG